MILSPTCIPPLPLTKTTGTHTKQEGEMDAVKRLASLAFFAVFTLGTVVQLNDPDPEV